jgi:hypothetical protein
MSCGFVLPAFLRRQKAQEAQNSDATLADREFRVTMTAFLF